MVAPRTRVALVSPFGLHVKGTTAARVLPIARQLVRQGADVCVIVPAWDDPEHAGAQFVDEGVSVVHTRAATDFRSPSLVVRDVWRGTIAWRPDVVHAFKPIGYSGAAAWLFMRRSAWRQLGHRPLVVVDCDDLEGRGGWAGRRNQRLGATVRGVQERTVIRAVDRVTVASHWLGTYAQVLRDDRASVHYLPNGHTVSERAERPDEDERVDLLWYTRLTEAEPRRVADLVAPLLRADRNIRLVVVGDTLEDGDEPSARAAFENLGIGSRVEWRGYDPSVLSRSRGRRGFVAIYPLDDDLVNRARCPSKIPQLMALGIPIVAERVGEASSYLDGFADECLVRPGDADGFRAKASALMEDASGRPLLSEKLEAAAERWRWDRTAEGLLDWYERGLREVRR